MSQEGSASLRTVPTAVAGNEYVLRRDPGLSEYAETFLDEVAAMPELRPTVGCIIPAYNEAESIAGVLDSLLMQTRLPDVIHVIVNNTTDDSVEIASHYAGPHTRMTPSGEQQTVIFVHDIGKNPDKKVGALNYGFSLVETMDFLLGVDGDTTPEPNAVETSSTRSPATTGSAASPRSTRSTTARSTDRCQVPHRRPARAVLGLQHAEPAPGPQHGGARRPVLDLLDAGPARGVMRQPPAHPVGQGQRGRGLAALAADQERRLPHQDQRHGPRPRRRHDHAAPLDAQQVKWNYGAIDLMWPGQRGDTKGQPFHPNLRLRWFEHFSMVINIFTRLGFVLLLAGSLSHRRLRLRAAVADPAARRDLAELPGRPVHGVRATGATTCSRVLLVPAEIYMWIRMGHFVRAWLKFFSRQQTDNWAAQAKAERGKGSAYLYPFLALVVFLVVGGRDLVAAAHRAAVGPPRVGWPILGVITVAPDRLDDTQGAAALPGVQGMSTRYARTRLAVAARAPCSPAA